MSFGQCVVATSGVTECLISLLDYSDTSFHFEGVRREAEAREGR